MDDRILPELDSEPPDSPARTACRELHDTLYRWMEITPARVVNRASAMASNGSKPYQAQLIARAGFAIPETLVTNDPELVRAFFAQHGRVVYKSVSGIALRRAGAHLERFRPDRRHPLVPGAVPGVRRRRGRPRPRRRSQIFATRVTSERRTTATRAWTADGRPALEATTLDDATAERCIDCHRELGARFSAIHLSDDPGEGEAVSCFEVNPQPGSRLRTRATPASRSRRRWHGTSPARRPER